MDFETYYRQLSRMDREKFADLAGTSTQYIEIHLLPRRKCPRRETMERLAAATGGACSYQDLVRYFLLNAA